MARGLSRLVARATCIALVWSLAMTSARADLVFYQPQTRDADASPDAWRATFGRLRRDGLDTVIVQWTRVGDITFGGPEGWLGSVLRLASASGMRFVVGLSSDPSAFEAGGTDVDPDVLAARLDADARRTVEQARRWRALTRLPGFAGWYLADELDDHAWSAPAKQRVLEGALARLRVQLGEIAPGPVMLSAYFTGYADPEAFSQWMQGLGAAGWTAMVQDGAGVDQGLSKRQRQWYLQGAFSCVAGRHPGVVLEAFRQISPPGTPFAARPATTAELAEQRTELEGLCVGPRALFSLRYLPAAEGTLRWRSSSQEP